MSGAASARRREEAELREAAGRLASHLEGRWLGGERSPIERAEEVIRLAIVGRRLDVLRRRFAPMAWGLINAARFGEARRLAQDALAVIDDAQVHHAMARASKELGDTQAARAAYGEALRRLEQEAAHEPVRVSAVDAAPTAATGASAHGGSATRDLSGVLCELAGLDREAGRREEAASGLARALDLAMRVLHDEAMEGLVLHEVAVMEMDAGRWESARARLLRALEIEQSSGDPRGIGRTLHSLAQCASRAGHDEEARALFEQALERKKEAGDREGEAVTLHDLALLTADDEVARSMHERSLEIGRRIGDARGVAANLRALASHALRRGELDVAEAQASESLRLARALGEPAAQAGALHQWASVHLRRGEMDAARARVDEALELAAASGDLRVDFELSLRWGQTESAREDGADRAMRLLDRAILRAEAMGDAARVAEATRRRVRLGDLRATPEAIARLMRAGSNAGRGQAWDELVQCCIELPAHDAQRATAWWAQALWLIAALVKGRVHAFALVPTLQVIGRLASSAPPDARRSAALAALAFELTPADRIGRLDSPEGAALHATLLAAAQRAGIAEEGLGAWMNTQVLPRSAELQAPLLDGVEALVPDELWLIDRGPLRRAAARGGRGASQGG